MGKAENRAVFEDTERLCRENKKLAESVRTSTAGQRLILEKDVLPEISPDIYEETAKVVVSKKRSFEAAGAYKKDKVAVHNFASALRPGGGVVNGANAQEECLCRCSGLYDNLSTQHMWEGFYAPHRRMQDPLHNDDIIFTPGVVVFKSDTADPVLLAEENWFSVDVITCAAPDLKGQPGISYSSGDDRKTVRITDIGLMELHEKRLRRILDVAVSEGDEVVILGAFGCGAFGNDPMVVAGAARNVLPDYLHAFKTIEYAVYCGPGNDRNYKVFEHVLRSFIK